MTEPLNKISRVKETGRNNSRTDNPKHEKLKRHQEETDDDCVDISEEAHNRATGKSRENILEYIENECG